MIGSRFLFNVLLPLILLSCGTLSENVVEEEITEEIQEESFQVILVDRQELSFASEVVKILHVPVPSEPFRIVLAGVPGDPVGVVEASHLPVPSTLFEQETPEPEPEPINRESTEVVKAEEKVEEAVTLQTDRESESATKKQKILQSEDSQRALLEDRVLNMEAVNGHSFSIRLNGRGWIFESSRENKGEIRLEDITEEEGDTLFFFKIESDEPVILSFQRQNNEKGIIEPCQVHVDILPSEASSDKLSDEREQNLSEETWSGDYRDLAEVLDRALTTDESDSLLLKQLEDNLFSLSAQPEIELVFREWKLDNNLYQWDEIAENLFRLGELYEKKGPLRDLKKAYSYYKRLYKDYPVSPSAPLAEKRMLYLDRYYLKIR